MTAKRITVPGVLFFSWAAGTYAYFLTKDEPPFLIVPLNFLRNLFSAGICLPADPSLAAGLLRTMAALALVTAVGGLLVNRVRRSCWRRMDWILAFAMGAILVAVPLEILAIFHLLSRWTVIGSFGLAAAAAALPWARWLREPQDGAATPEAEACGEESPAGWERSLWWLGAALVALISLFTFYHAVGFPAVYWDSLIYYINYAQWTYEQGGFPEKVCAQVGLGLGANYPHLFHLLQVIPAFLFGAWSPVPGQFLPPLLGLLATIVVYRTVRIVGRGPLAAMLVAVLFRGIPYTICYFISATDYALAVFLTALFVELAARLGKDLRVSSLLFLGLTAAGAAKVNYLMPVLLAAFAAVAVWFLRRRSRPPQFPRGLAILAVSIALASTWYARNWAVAGNPVYPFFHRVLDGKRIDERVLRSCEQEWLSNGEGTRRFALELERAAGNELAAMGPFERTLRRLWWMTAGFFLIAEPNYHWKLAPCFVAWSVPGFLALAWSLGLRRRGPAPGDNRVFALIPGALFAFFLVYEYFIAGIYLYQIIPIAVPMALLAHRPIQAMKGTLERPAAAVLVLLMGAVPGLSMAMMGPKIMSPRIPAMVLHRLPPDPGTADVSPDRRFLTLKFGDDYRMWEFMNRSLPRGARVLSHENRHLYIRDDIDIVHLDDWELSRLYRRPWPRVREYLVENRILHYLRIPNERNHPIVEELGLERTLSTDWELLIRLGGNSLYRLKAGGESSGPG